MCSGVGTHPNNPLTWKTGLSSLGKGRGARPYDRVINRDVLDICLKNIKVVHEDIKDGRDKYFARAVELMQEAERIYYLGFGYAPANVERLKISSLGEKFNYGTGRGLTQKECSDASRLAGGPRKAQPAPRGGLHSVVAKLCRLHLTKNVAQPAAFATSEGGGRLEYFTGPCPSRVFA